jgi:hypothetical protein
LKNPELNVMARNYYKHAGSTQLSITAFFGPVHPKLFEAQISKLSVQAQ